LGGTNNVAGEGNVSCAVLENGRNEDLLALLWVYASGSCIPPGRRHTAALRPAERTQNVFIARKMIAEYLLAVNIRQLLLL
jgi:hypothetical protein